MMRSVLFCATVAIAFTVAVVADVTVKCTGINEAYENSYDPCPIQSCRAYVAGVVCKPETRKPSSGCRCKDGYYRNYLGTCVSGADCLKCSKPHEFPDCGSACDNECATRGQQNRTDCPIQNIVCNDWCYCEDGFSRDACGNCIRNEDC